MAQHSVSAASAREEARGRRRRHLEMLGVAVGVVVLAVLLQVQPDQRVAFRFLPAYPLPQTCLARSLFGVNCPGCGLTRSFIHLAHGDWRRSLATHHLGWLLASAILFQFPYRVHALRHGDCSEATLVAYRCFGYFLLVMLLGNWLCQMVLECF